jgi:hypothetical protein
MASVRRNSPPGKAGAIPRETRHWETATRLADEGHELASRTGQAIADMGALTLDAMVEACRGNVAAARSKGKASLALSEQADDSPALIRSLKPLGLLELSLGDPGKAVEYLERGVELEAGAGYGPAVLRILPDVIEALLAAGGCRMPGRLSRAWRRRAGDSTGPGPWPPRHEPVASSRPCPATLPRRRRHSRAHSGNTSGSPSPSSSPGRCSSWGASSVAPSGDQRHASHSDRHS